MPHEKPILVVDDEPKIVEVVQSYLENAGYQTVCAFTGNEALAQFEAHSPQLVILDLMLPDISGEDILRTLRRKSRVPVIMLTAKVEEENILHGLNIGADDYVTKPFSPRQLVARVDAILRRTADSPDPDTHAFSINHGEMVIDNLRHEVRKNGVPVALTLTEYKLLMTMVKYPAKAFTREELIAFALGDEYEGYDRVIDTHIKNLRQKIEEDVRNPRLILTVHGIGYRFGGESA